VINDRACLSEKGLWIIAVQNNSLVFGFRTALTPPSPAREQERGNQTVVMRSIPDAYNALRFRLMVDSLVMAPHSETGRWSTIPGAHLLFDSVTIVDNKYSYGYS
jgi:hypothetical protein